MNPEDIIKVQDSKDNSELDLEPLVTSLVSTNFERAGSEIFRFLDAVHKVDEGAEVVLFNVIDAIKPSMKDKKSLGNFISSFSSLTNSMSAHELSLSTIFRIEYSTIESLLRVYAPGLNKSNPVLFIESIVSFINRVNQDQTILRKDYLKLMLRNHLIKLNILNGDSFNLGLADENLIINTLLGVDKSIED